MSQQWRQNPTLCWWQEENGRGWVDEMSFCEIHDFQSLVGYQSGCNREDVQGKRVLVAKVGREMPGRVRKLSGEEGWEGQVRFLRRAAEGFGNE